MKILEVALLISSLVWCVAFVYLIYGLGLSILTLTLEPGLTAVILMLFATGAQFLLVILVG
jgi:hypothetical protein